MNINLIINYYIFQIYLRCDNSMKLFDDISRKNIQIYNFKSNQ